ncbi:hypothetical protein MTO96_019148 [Rhipicephalus appendiculatus]
MFRRINATRGVRPRPSDVIVFTLLDGQPKDALESASSKAPGHSSSLFVSLFQGPAILLLLLSPYCVCSSSSASFQFALVHQKAQVTVQGNLIHIYYVRFLLDPRFPSFQAK